MSSSDTEKPPVAYEPTAQKAVDDDRPLKENALEDGSVKEPSNENSFPEGGTRGWAVAIACAMVLFCTFGYANAFGVLQEYYETHQLKSRSPSTISWIGSLQNFFLFAGSLLGGPLFDRYGAKVLWPAVLAHVFAVMMTSICKEYYQFILAQGVLGGIAMGMSMAPSMAATSQYFNKKRGAALGIAVAGSSVGGVIFPIALSRMLVNPKLGFGWAIRICGFIMLAVLLPSCVMVRARVPPRSGRFLLPSAFKEPLFVSIIGSIFLMMLGLFTPFFYLPTYAIDHGMSTQLASYLISILNGASFFGRVIPGIMADKVGRLNMMMAAAISTGILILCLQRMTTNATIILFSALYGFCSGAIVSLMSANLAQVPKNPANIGTYLGMGMAVISIGALIGPPINGALVTRYHSFNQTLTMSGVFVVVGGCSLIFAKLATGNGVFVKH